MDAKVIPAEKAAAKSALSLAIVGNCLAQSKTVAMPFWIAGAVSQLSVSKSDVGLIGSGEFACVAIAAALGAFVVDRKSPRTLAIMGAVLMVFGNLTSLCSRNWIELSGSRALAGVGEGLLFAVSHAAAVYVRNADRGFAAMQTVGCLYSIILTICSAFVLPIFGIDGVFTLLLASSLAGLGAFWGLPRQVDLRGASATGVTPRPGLGVSILALTPLFLVAVGSQGIWSYAVLGGARVGLASDAIAPLLSSSLLLGAGGGLVSLFLAGRVSHYLPILMGIATLGLSVGLFCLSSSKVPFLVGIAIGPLGFGFLVPFLYGIMARIDPSGRLAGSGPVASMLGSIFGPPLTGLSFGANGPWVFLAPALVSLIAIFPLVVTLDARSAKHLGEIRMI